MSLINEALKRARVEAARRDAAEKGVPLSALPTYTPPQRQAWLAPAFGFVVGLLVVTLAAGVFFFVRRPPASAGGERIASQPIQVETVSSASAQEPSPPPTLAAVEPVRVEASRLQVATPQQPLARTVEVKDSVGETRADEAPLASRPPEQPQSTTGSGAALTPHLAVGSQAAPVARSTASPTVAVPPSAVPSPAPPQPVAVAEPPVETSAMSAVDPPAVGSKPTAPLSSEPSAAVAVPGAQANSPSVAQAPNPPNPAADTDGPSFFRQAAPAGATVKVDFIVWSESRPFAQINGELLSPGQSIEGYTLIEVERERVQLEGGGIRFWLRVR